MKKIFLALLLVCAVPFTFAVADEESSEEQIDYSKKVIYNASCFINKDTSGQLDEGTKGAVGCPPGRDQTFGRAVNAFSRRNSSMTCPFAADYYFFSHTDGKCYKYETTKANKLEAEGGRWICYSKDSNNCM